MNGRSTIDVVVAALLHDRFRRRTVWGATVITTMMIMTSSSVVLAYILRPSSLSSSIYGHICGIHGDISSYSDRRPCHRQHSPSSPFGFEDRINSEHKIGPSLLSTISSSPHPFRILFAEPPSSHQQQEQQPPSAKTWDEWYEQHQQQTDPRNPANNGSEYIENTTDGNTVTSDNINRRRSVMDVVQGLHGSKYDFGSSSSFMSFEGRQFAEQGYSSGTIYDSEQQGSLTNGSSNGGDSIIDDDSLLPKWATKLLSVPDDIQLGTRSCPQIELSSSTTGSTKVVIQNEERSWEKFYARVVVTSNESSDGSSFPSIVDENKPSKFLQVQPSSGMLAPRGNNSLDLSSSSSSSSSPTSSAFSDTIVIHVVGSIPTMTTTTTANSNDDADDDDDKTLSSSCRYWLRIGTEAEKWTYELI